MGMTLALFTAALDAVARGAIPLAGAAMIVLAFALLLARRTAPLIAASAVQGALLALAVLAQAWLQASVDLLLAAALALAAQAVAVPMLLRHIAPLLPDAPPRAMVVPASAAVALAALAVALATGAAPDGHVLAAPLALLLLGFLALAVRRDDLGRTGGVLVLGNALVLALAAAPGMPGSALVALATLALPAASAGMLARRTLAGGTAP